MHSTLVDVDPSDDALYMYNIYSVFHLDQIYTLVSEDFAF